VKGKPLNNLLGLTPHTKMKCYDKWIIYIIWQRYNFGV
jgi:hypothetical protein